MKYQLIEQYFDTPLFQNTIQDYFDTVLGKIIADKTTLAAKGLFVVKGEVKRDFYDMPYHIHILNGLIPALLVYEKFLQQEGWTESPTADVYLRIFILGFTFHDANKLLGIEKGNGRSDLENAMIDLENHFEKWAVTDFLKDFETHKSTVKFLALGTEHGSAVASNEYKISVKNWKHVNEVQRELCHLADGLASILNDDKNGIDHLGSIENIYNAVQKSLKNVCSPKIPKLPISYVKVRQNPYTLLSQNLLQVAQKQLRKRGKKVLFATREGFVFWGEDITDEEYDLISSAYLEGSADDIKFAELTNIDAQKCKFGFVGSTPFTNEILEEITVELANKFLSLSPNGKSKIDDFDTFVTFTKKLKDSCDAPIEEDTKDDKLTLRFYDKEKMSEEDEIFRTIFNLHKIQWLNAKENKAWKKDFDEWTKSNVNLSEPIELELETDVETLKFSISTVADVRDFIKTRVKSTNALYKTYLNLIKTHQTITEANDIDEYVADLQENILTSFTPKDAGENVKQALFDRYFECRGNVNLRFLENYNPTIPIKKEMCAFTGGVGTVDYKAEVAFGMKARGFSNRTITALNNNTSHVSALFAEENKLRASLFKVSDSNLVIYHDFFEAKLDVDKDIIQSCVAAKDELQFLKDGTILFDKKAKFLYNLYNLEFIKLAPKVEPTFFLVRKCLRMVKVLGIRSYIAGIMTPYQPHKAVFHFENPPQFLKDLGWNSVRLLNLEEVLDEIRLVLTFGKNRIESNLLKIAKSRLAYFSIYYGLNDDDKRKVYSTLVNFYTKYKHKFSSMTITEELVELAVKIDTQFQSSAGETWLIRTAFDYLRKYHKQEYSREDIIQKTCGEIFRKMRMSNPSMEAIQDFATAIYDELFLKDWKGKVLTVNQEKDWIYQFAFLFRQKSLEIARTRQAKSIKDKLAKSGKAITEENVKGLLKDNQSKYANQYLETIKNL